MGEATRRADSVATRHFWLLLLLLAKVTRTARDWHRNPPWMACLHVKNKRKDREKNKNKTAPAKQQALM